MARILVADDDEDMQLIIQLTLESVGHTVVLASDGREALGVALGGSVDLALLDVSMPLLRGHEVVTQVRADPGRRNLPILVVSANSLLDDIDLGLRAGADDYLTKPFTTFELKRRVERMVWLSQQVEAERTTTRRTAMETLGRLLRRD